MGVLTIEGRQTGHVVGATARPHHLARVAGVVVALVTVTALPYLYGYMAAGPDRQFMGIVLNVPDTAQYFSWARESAHSVLIENKLSPEPGAPVYFNLFWLVVGRIASATGLGIAEITQLIRPLAGVAYVGAIYWLVAVMTPTHRERWTAFLVAALGGGLGWLLVVEKQVTGSLSAPLDLYVTEANTVLTVMAFPLQAMAGALQILTLGLAALAFEHRSSRTAAIAGLLGLVLGLQHGYDLLIIYAVVGTLGLVLAVRDGSWLRAIGLAALVCGPSVPAAAYLAVLTRESPIWRGVLAQYGNAGVYTPTPPHLLVLMGVPLLILVGGIPLALLRSHQIRSWLQHASPRELLIWSWLVVGFLLIYIPTDFQIKMLACWQVPLAIAATRVLFLSYVPALRHWQMPRLAHAAAFVFVLAVLPVNLYLVAWRLVDLGRADYPYYLSRDEVGALRWLENNSSPSDVVLSSLTVGQYVPSVSGNTAFLAHWAQTLDFYTKRRLVQEYFSPALSEEDRDRLLATFNVRYVFLGPQERALGSYAPVDSPDLAVVYANAGVTLYRVRS